ncbi:MAG: hypothetical protein ACRBBK_13740 [Paracoccaceae bacterium]
MKKFALAAAFSLAASLAHANDFAPAMEAFVDNQASTWANDPQIIEAIRAQNTQTSAYDQSRIDALDTEWRAAVNTPENAVIASVLNSKTSDYLRSIVQDAGGAVAEIIVMDAKGLNVAVSAVTSDYWQGDEAKHAKTYGVGPGARLIDEVEFDESTQAYVGQVSIAVTDPDTGNVIGAITIGLDAEALL